MELSITNIESSWRPRDKTLLFVMFFLLGVSRILVFEIVYTADQHRIISPDTVRYEAPALLLLENGSMRDYNPVGMTQDFHVAPLYPYIISKLYGVFGVSHRALVYFQILVSLATLAVLYLTAKFIWGERVAYFVAAFFSLDPLQFLYSQILLSETVYIFFSTLVFYFCTRLIKQYSSRRRILFAGLIGLTLGLMTMVKPIGYYVIFCILIGLAGFHAFNKIRFNWYPGTAAAMMLTFFIVVVPWHVRNGQISGSYIFTDNPSIIMLYWKAAGMISHRDDIKAKSVRKQLKSTMPATYESVAEKITLEQSKAKEIILGDIPAYVRFTFASIKDILIGPGLDKFGLYMYGDRYNPNAKTGFSIQISSGKSGVTLSYLFIIFYSSFFVALMYLLFAKGAYDYFRKKKNLTVLVLAVALSLYYLLASSGHSAADSRMRLPMTPLLVLFAGYGCCNVLSRRCKKSTAKKMSSL